MKEKLLAKFIPVSSGLVEKIKSHGMSTPQGLHNAHRESGSWHFSFQFLPFKTFPKLYYSQIWLTLTL
jgi:hypothetical protein